MLFKSKNQSQRQGQKNADEPLIAIDIGSTVIRIIAGRVDSDGQVEIIGYSQAQSKGVTKGAVTDIQELGMSLASLVREFMDQYHIQFDKCMVAVPGCFIRSYNEHGTATVVSGMVTIADRNHAIENARAGLNLDSESELIHVIPQNYITQTSQDVINPVGQYAKRIEVNTHIIDCQKSHTMNLRSVISMISADMCISDIIYSGIAASNAVLTEGEKEIGVCHIDIGGGTVSVTVYDNKRLILSFGFSSGGDMITQAIAKRFGLSMNAAEKLKISQGFADPQYMPPEIQEAKINVRMKDPFTDQDVIIPVSAGDLASEIKSCLTNICWLIGDKISRFVSDHQISLRLGAGFVLTGGVANTKYIDRVIDTELIQRTASYYSQIGINKVRIGRARGVHCDLFDVRALQMPELAVAVGLLRCGNSSLTENYSSEIPDEPKGVKSRIQKIKEWFSREL